MTEQIHCELLVHNAYLITMDESRRIIDDGALAIESGNIIAVGKTDELRAKYRGAEQIDAAGAPVHPGFIDPHTHLSLTTIRDLSSDVPDETAAHANEEIANTYHRYVEALDDADEYASTLLACAEFLESGYTCVVDPGTVFEPDVAAQAMTEVGIRGSLGDPFLIDRVATQTSGHPRAPLSRERCDKLLGSQLWRNRQTDSLVGGHVAIYGMGANSPEFTGEAIAFAKAEGAAFTQHISTAPDDYEDLTAACDNTPPFVYFQQQGWFEGDNEALNFVHANCVSDEEIAVIGEAGISICWNPVNPLYYGLARIMPCRMAEVARSGGNLSLCNDVINSWAPTDIFLIAHLHGRAYGDVVSTEQLLEMSTINAARAAGMADRIGSLEVGKRADLVIRSSHVLEASPSALPLYSHFLRARSKSIDRVLVDGRTLVANGELASTDKQQAIALAEQSRQRLATAIDFRSPMRWPVL